MTAAHPLVRHATAQDAEAITHILSRSFYDDPPLIWILPNDGERPRLSRVFFRPFVDMVLAGGNAYITDDLTGACLWLHVDVNAAPEDDGGAFRKLFLDGLGPASAERFFLLDDLFNAGHPEHESHAYLLFAGVLPERQSQGIGTAMISRLLANLDRNGQSAYLESSSQRNERLYRRMGFAPIGNPVELPNGPKLVRMWRAPNRAAMAATETA